MLVTLCDREQAWLITDLQHLLQIPGVVEAVALQPLSCPHSSSGSNLGQCWTVYWRCTPTRQPAGPCQRHRHPCTPPRRSGSRGVLALLSFMAGVLVVGVVGALTWLMQLNRPG